MIGKDKDSAAWGRREFGPIAYVISSLEMEMFVRVHVRGGVRGVWTVPPSSRE